MNIFKLGKSDLSVEKYVNNLLNKTAASARVRLHFGFSRRIGDLWQMSFDFGKKSGTRNHEIINYSKQRNELLLYFNAMLSETERSKG
ncbi:hypothetical protein Q0V21_01280 [Paenibacillus sp. 11B]|uniref:hypothetical protein n=1 Tax=Paenibacillus sp. 1A_MP2 TaxID=3457495 RepID=UPI0026550ACD|nr:hypothetical protein [Paenibacillus sp. 11B]